MDLEEQLQKSAIGQLPRVEDNFNCFGMTFVIAIGRIPYVTTRISDPR